jgi:uncharacterized protein (DUF433 family)
MPVLETVYEHVKMNAKGCPVIGGTSMKVTELIVEKMAYGWSAEELHFQHPHLTLGQIHSALAYYWDHTEELDEDIAKRLNAVKALQSRSALSPLVRRLMSKEAV